MAKCERERERLRKRERERKRERKKEREGVCVKYVSKCVYKKTFFSFAFRLYQNKLAR